MSVIVFEDDGVARLNSVTLGKPCFAITCGSYRLLDLLVRLRPSPKASPTSEGVVTAQVRPHLEEITAEDYCPIVADSGAVDQVTLLVNGRLVPSVSTFERLAHWYQTGRAVAVYSGETLVAAVVTPEAARGASVAKDTPVEQLAAKLKLESVEEELPCFEFPHDIIRHHLTTLSDNLSDRLRQSTLPEVADGVFMAPDATLGQYVVTDTREGPILIESGATVGPYTLLHGPAYIGRDARVLEHAALKDGVSLGHTTKIGGEIEASIIEPFSNKQHYGFMGHSYLGSWINLGAGTCNSDLKNTYGIVNMEYGGKKVATGMQFLGAIIGDYAKTAINTGIFTGKTIGVCSMVYGFVTRNVPSFVNYARHFGQVTEAPVSVLEATQARMFARRGVAQRPCDIQLLHDMYRLTAHERQLSDESLAL